MSDDHPDSKGLSRASTRGYFLVDRSRERLNRGVNDYPIIDFERALSQSPLIPLHATGKVSRPLTRRIALKLNGPSLWKRVVAPRSVILVPLMGMVDAPKLWPHGIYRDVALYCWDCWPNRYVYWARLMRRYGVSAAFFSSRAAVDHFRTELPRMRSEWIPEACDPASYLPGDALAERGIDVLELGRRHEPFHGAITEPTAAAGWSHLYVEPGAPLLFPDFTSLTRGLANSKVSVCFPKSMTHPKQARGAETVTLRYFESIASRCVLYGHGPTELADLFGYNPVVEVDMDDPSRHLLDVLAHIESYQELVDRNYATLLKVGTWDSRVRDIIRILQEGRLLSS